MTAARLATMSHLVKDGKVFRPKPAYICVSQSSPFWSKIGDSTRPIKQFSLGSTQYPGIDRKKNVAVVILL